MKICDYYGIYSFTKCNSTSNQMIDNGKPKNQIKKKRNRSYCSIQIIDPSKQEIFALRLLLFNFAGRSYDDLKTVDGRLYSSFYEASFHRGLVGNSNEYFICLNEANFVINETINQVNYISIKDIGFEYKQINF